MMVELKQISELKRADYNPRVDLRPGDSEYEALSESIEEFDLVVPLVWNERTGRLVSGHQRLTILENDGKTEVEVSVVDLDEIKEKQLNIALNNIEGEFDNEKLVELLEELGEDFKERYFTQAELDRLENDINGLIDSDALEAELGKIKDIYNLTLKFDIDDRRTVEGYIKERGKDGLVEVLLREIGGE